MGINLDERDKPMSTDDDQWNEYIEVEGGVENNTTPAGADFLLCYASAEGTCGILASQLFALKINELPAHTHYFDHQAY